jgi:hypothetical protein
MAKKDEEKPLPTIEECMSALAALTATVSGLAASMKSLNDKPVATMSAVEELKTQLIAESAERTKLAAAQTTFISEQTAKLAEIAKTRAALGLKGDEVAGKLAAGADHEPVDADRSKKTYLALVEAKKAEGKLSATDCHRYVMNAHPEAYRQHQIDGGILRK